MANPFHFVISVKTWIVHFFKDTSTGQTIEHIALAVIGRDGLAAFLKSIEDKIMPEAEKILAEVLTGASPAQIFLDLEGAVVRIAVAEGHDIKTNWGKFAVARIYEQVAATNPTIADAMAKAGAGPTTTAPTV
jgi:hypothetical protein